MKAYCLIAFFAAFLILPTAGHAQLAYKLSQRPFHSPQTPAEQALDRVLHLENSTTTAQLAGFLTPQLANTIANANRGRAHDVLLCTENNPRTFLYQTINDNGQAAEIAYALPGTKQFTATYKLVNVNGTWQIDGITCSDGNTFNMDEKRNEE